MKPDATVVVAMVWSLLMIGAFTSAPAHATPLGTNLILNPGAEANTGATGVGAESSNVSITGWTKLGRMTVVQYQSPPTEWPMPSDPGPPDRLLNFFAGGDEDVSSISQIFGVSDLEIQIDAGHVSFDLEGWFGGWEFQEDYATLTASFLNGSGAEIDSVSIGGVTAAERHSDNGLLFREKTGTVPAGTSSIQVVLESVRMEGFSNDGYADNLSLVLTTVPEPSTLLLMGMGLTGLGAFGSRPRREGPGSR